MLQTRAVLLAQVRKSMPKRVDLFRPPRHPLSFCDHSSRQDCTLRKGMAAELELSRGRARRSGRRFSGIARVSDDAVRKAVVIIAAAGGHVRRQGDIVTFLSLNEKPVSLSLVQQSPFHQTGVH